MQPVELMQVAIAQVQDPRFFETERGYQGELAAAMRHILAEDAVWPGNPIVEQEYQKRAGDHGIRLRPDIIVHVPFNRPGITERTEGNYLVVMLKLSATLEKAAEDFEKLQSICKALEYAEGAFVNVASNKLFLPDCRLPTNRFYTLREYSVSLVNGQVRVEYAVA